MKISIRQGVFETNSSSVHSCSVCTSDEYKKWKKGEIWYNEGDDKYLPVNEAIEFNLNFIKKDNEMTDEEFKTFAETYKKTKSMYEAYESIDWDGDEDDFDPYDIYLDIDKYWEMHEYEDWSHTFKDTAGIEMVAWGYCGHD